jgi:hypothetical protein
MEDVKSWLLSKTVWSSLLQIVVGIVVSSGWINASGGQALLTSGPDFAVGIVTVILGGISLYGRVTAKTVLV